MNKQKLNIKAREFYKESGVKNITFAMDMGTGKTKLGIDLIKDHSPKTVLITSPAGNITGTGLNSWIKEFEKWGNPQKVDIEIANVQKTYKYEHKYYDMVIIDEIHGCLSPEYSKLLLNNKFGRIIGLTGTPEDNKPEKLALYNKYCPILFRYLDSAKDGLINKTRVLVFERELDNNFKIQSGNSKKRFYQGELERYEYLTEQIRKGQRLMAAQDSEDWWNDAKEWFYNNNAPSNEAKMAAIKYLNSIKFRKNMLLGLSSTVFYAKAIKEAVLEKKNSKVLIFAELIKQLKEIEPNCVHSGNTDIANEKLVEAFNKGDIESLGASKKLTLGVNLKGVNYGLLADFVGSSTGAAQKKGRLHRLAEDDIATLVVFKIKNTQQEKWFSKIVDGFNVENIHYYTDINKLIKDL